MMSPFTRPSIRTLLLLLVLAVALPFLALFAWMIQEEARNASEDAYDQAHAVSGNVASSLATLIADREKVLEQFALRPEIRAMDAKRCDSMIVEYARLRPELAALAVFDLDGKAICSSLPEMSSREQVGRFPWFAESVHRAAFLASNAFLGPKTNKWVTVLTYPIRGNSGNPIGVLIMSVDLASMATQAFLTVPERMLVVVTDREESVLLRSLDHGDAVGKPMPFVLAMQARGLTKGAFADKGADGLRNLYAFTNLPIVGWRVWTAIPEDAVLAAYREKLGAGLALVVPVLMLALGASWWIGSAIASPIRDLAGTAELVAKGTTSARAQAAGLPEVRSVALQFNRMLDTLERNRADREAIAGHYAELMKQARDIVMLVDPEMRIVEANEAASAAYGYTAEEFRSLRARDFRTPDEIATLERDWEQSRKPEGVLVETVHRRKDGSTFPVELSARVIEIDGKPYRQSFIRDITARKQAEAALQESEANFRAVVESAPEGIFIQSGGRFAYANAETLRIFGYARLGDLVGQPVIERFHPDWRDRVRERIRLLNEEHRPAEPLDEVCLRADGSSVDVIVSSIPFDYEGRRARWCSPATSRGASRRRTACGSRSTSFAGGRPRCSAARRASSSSRAR
jgi:PAS domain S-box-containing protein